MASTTRMGRSECEVRSVYSYLIDFRVAPINVRNVKPISQLYRSIEIMDLENKYISNYIVIKQLLFDKLCYQFV